jgi:glycosyltransferase involved in cell wall biosynthesis
MNDSPPKFKELVCFSHLRWNFVYQRPQHLISRFTRICRVFFVEEPIFHSASDTLEVSESAEGVVVVVPKLQDDNHRPDVEIRLQELLERFFEAENIVDYLFWYYTPMALKFTRDFEPGYVVFDCMDELSAFKSASPELKSLEQELMSRADIVFAGGQSLFEAKRKNHPRTYLFPSSIDKQHFARARTITFDPADQDSIPYPRLGYFGVIDERLDIDLLEKVALLRPSWNFIMIGPVVKIDPMSLPRFPNIYYLGSKSYGDLPGYLAGWDIALIPFAHNESTRFISPTKTPEYLAAGKPVVSTPIIDVIRPYGNKGLVRIAGTADEFVRVAEEELQVKDRGDWLESVDRFLSVSSWDITWNEMVRLINASKVGKKVEGVNNAKGQEYV